MTVDQQRWAGAYYRVERESSGVMMRKRQRRKATELAIEHGDPIPIRPEDVVRIFDRSGKVVFERDWGTDRVQAMAHEARVIEDLLHLDVLTFRAKYGIPTPEEEGLPGASDTSPRAAPHAAEAPSTGAPADPDPGPGGGGRALGAS